MPLSGLRWNSALGSRVTSCSHSHLEGFIANFSVQRQFFPTDEDEMGAAKALMRLQDTYKLDPDTISKGELPGNSPPQVLPVQCVCLLQCLDRVGAPADLWSAPSGAPLPLVVISRFSSWCQSPIPMTPAFPQPLPLSLPPCHLLSHLSESQGCCSAPLSLCPQKHHSDLCPDPLPSPTL